MKRGISVGKKEEKMNKTTRNSLIFSSVGLVASLGVLAMAVSHREVAFAVVAASVTTMYAGLFVFFLKRALEQRKEAKAIAEFAKH